MTSTTVNHVTTHGVRSAAVDLLISLKNLVVGVWRAASFQSVAAPVALSAAQEAENLRTFASQFVESDPEFAQDLFVQADRHEYAALGR